VAYEEYKEAFVEAQPLGVQFNDLGKIIEKLLEFFEESNRRLGAG